MRRLFIAAVVAIGATSASASGLNQPQWQWDGSADNLTCGRGHANAVLLANGEVFLVGGGSISEQECPIFVPEVFDPATENWTALTSAMHTHPRMYHSVALLLMDGSVWTAGQNVDSSCQVPGPCPTCAPETETWPHGGDRVEIYRPPYFFDASRPTITDVQASVEPEEVFDVAYTVGNGRSMDNEDGARVALIQPLRRHALRKHDAAVLDCSACLGRR